MAILECPYRKICSFYTETSYTCNEAPGPYCGRYRTFERKLGHPVFPMETSKNG